MDSWPIVYSGKKNLTALELGIIFPYNNETILFAKTVLIPEFWRNPTIIHWCQKVCTHFNREKYFASSRAVNFPFFAHCTC